MKRLVCLAVLVAFILGTAGMASAIELKAKGWWRVHFNYLDNWDFGAMQQASPNKDRSEYDRFDALQRMRTQFEFVANENLKGVLQMEIGNARWGADNFDLGAGGRSNNIKTRFAYLDFNFPGTPVNVKAGRQPVALPSTMGSHILESEGTGVLVGVPFSDMAGLTLGWVRAFNHDRANPDDITKKWDDEVDAFVAVVPVTLDGLKLNPFAAYTRWGKDFTGTDKNANMMHFGLNFDVSMLNPIGIKGDLNYGTMKWNDKPSVKQSGWVAVLAVDYAMDMMTPTVFGWYESGEDKDFATGGDSKRMPTIETYGGAFGPGVGFGQQTTMAGDSYFRYMLAGMEFAGTGNLWDVWQNAEGAVGSVALGAGLKKIQFIDGVSHDLTAFYMKGTNHKDNIHLFTKEDNYWEVTFNNRWQMYENLALLAEFAYAKVNLDDLSTRGADRRSDWFDKAMKLGKVGFIFNF
ncbi:outer membrane homotrimeric porin [Desulfonatronum lacustre]|uniref:outer membrane homotrimeric porin n=1 Tax=Desulfonatronum lacustre TaxID=66849 RepID=UPI00048F8E75|nr:outer membrane homotrimeric porin [Desulfonatronum lacustre]